VTFSCRSYSYAESYPDLGPILSMEGGHTVKLPEGMKEAVDRAEIFSADVMEVENRIKVTLTQGKLVLRGEGMSGWYEENCKVDFDGDELSFIMDPVLFRDVVSRAPTVDVGRGMMRVELDTYVHVACLAIVEDPA
jgi:hypothetical protein